MVDGSNMEEMEKLLISVLQEHGELTTSEVEKRISTVNSCPDGPVKLLMKLKREGVVVGRIDRGRKGWVWGLKEG